MLIEKYLFFQIILIVSLYTVSSICIVCAIVPNDFFNSLNRRGKIKTDL